MALCYVEYYIYFPTTMRIWHEKLIPKLCQKHLCAMWREGLGAFKIIIEGKRGYANHPATREWECCPYRLHRLLRRVRSEMLMRGYHPKEMPTIHADMILSSEPMPVEWQTLEEQIEVLKSKGCKCDV